ATNTRDDSIVRSEFSGLKALFLKFQSFCQDMQIISMGMSTDYEIAIQQGSTMVRVGSAIFGRRN
ncbi:MAG: YggS family pyridoxal phosphate-dependent enzyme, partial [Flavobacteriales bacterium]|nr:YggS family pyridoxal phosphate-dependent enzyme [Flavobacteriales bacterium]